MPRMKRWASSTRCAPSSSGDIFVNSLMSAPALNVKMFEEAITSARALPPTSSQRSIRSRTACGESGFAGGRFSHAIATSPRVSSSTVSRWSPGVGLRIGEEALAGLLAQPALRHQPPQHGGRLEGVAPLRLGALELLEHVSRPASSARENGPGRMPAPIIIPTSMSFAEATPSSSTRQDSTRVLRPMRSTIVWRPDALAVLIEALPRLLAEVARLDQLLHPLGHVEALAAV